MRNSPWIRLMSFAGLAIIGTWLSFSTTPVSAYAVTSDTAVELSEEVTEAGWTWAAFNKAVVVGTVVGAVGGALAGAAGNPGALVGAAVGGVAGALAGGVTYAAGEAYEALVGGEEPNEKVVSYPAAALD